MAKRATKVNLGYRQRDVPQRGSNDHKFSMITGRCVIENANIVGKPELFIDKMLTIIVTTANGVQKLGTISPGRDQHGNTYYLVTKNNGSKSEFLTIGAAHLWLGDRSVKSPKHA